MALGRGARRAAVGCALAAMAWTGALAQNETNQAASSGAPEPRIACLYEQLPTIAKLRFELAARLGGEAVVEVVRGAREAAFKELIEFCGFAADAEMVDLATRYWSSRSARNVAAIEADRAGANVDTLGIALAVTTPKDAIRDAASAMMTDPAEAAQGPAGVAVASALTAYQEADGPLPPEALEAAATFLAAEVIVLGLENGARPASETAPAE